MLKVIKNKDIKNNSKNILLSLEYLKEEAKRENNFSLYKIIDTACILAKETETLQTGENILNDVDDDLFNAAHLLLKFLKSSPEAKQNFLEMLESEEF